MEMLNGSGDYLGNEKLHGYCVIDLMKLMLALKIALANEASLFKRYHRFDCRSVMYSKKIYRYEPDADIYSDMNARSAPSPRMRPMQRCNIASKPWRRSQLGCRASRRMVRSLMTRPNAGWPSGWWTGNPP